jgi:hypothetical protein
LHLAQIRSGEQVPGEERDQLLGAAHSPQHLGQICLQAELATEYIGRESLALRLAVHQVPVTDILRL